MSAEGEDCLSAYQRLNKAVRRLGAAQVELAAAEKEHIESRVPAEDYFALPGISITRLKELRRSPKHSNDY